MARVVVGMSGGVDSSLAAALLAEQGHEVVGVTLKLWPCAEFDGGFTRPDACCSPSETRDARAVAVGRGIAHYVVDAEDEFRRAVVEDFLDGYAAGRTPSPCVRCNESIKFGSLWRHAQALGAERLGTGHYARRERHGDRWLLRRAADRAKDQTYFLCTLDQEQIAAAEFPVGGLDKAAVRAAARERGLPTADKHESMDLCFIGTDGVAGLLRRERPDAFRPGPIVDEDGRVLGEHQGLGLHTVGQRKGLGLAGSAEPLLVLRLDQTANALVVGPRARLLCDGFRLEAPTWHLAPPGFDGLRCTVRPRHRSPPLPATVMADGTVRLDAPAVRPAPGQVCAIYDPADEVCLGGGWIS
jgi:tRNA-specific 2-thiouridylase